MTLEGIYVPSTQQWVRDQVSAYEESDGEQASTLRESDDPIVVITSVGAKSGHLRKNPVMKVEREGKYVAVASQGGAPENPKWFHNFVAHPEVELQDGPQTHTYIARLLSGDERAEWWDYAVETWPTYGKYQQRTAREIPVFLLEPVA